MVKAAKQTIGEKYNTLDSVSLIASLATKRNVRCAARVCALSQERLITQLACTGSLVTTLASPDSSFSSSIWQNMHRYSIVRLEWRYESCSPLMMTLPHLQCVFVSAVAGVCSCSVGHDTPIRCVYRAGCKPWAGLLV